MDQKLKELTEKLYLEGVAKGNEQAEQLITNAKKESEKLLAETKAQAAALVAEAEKKAADLEKNTRSELQLAAKQMIGALQQEVTSLVNGNIISDEIKQATSNKDFIQQLILAAVTNWAPKQDLLVAVPENDKAAAENFFATKAKNLLEKGLKIESANNIKAGFQIGPADGSYKVSFTEEDFIEFFKAFLRPKVVELLFDRK